MMLRNWFIVTFVFLLVYGTFGILKEDGNSYKAVIVGNTVTLSCSINDRDPLSDHNDTTVTTWNHGKPEPPNTVLKVQFTQGQSPKLLHNSDSMKYDWSDSEASLIIRDVDLSDAGNYSCKAEFGQTVKETPLPELLVLGKPQCQNLNQSVNIRNLDQKSYYMYDCGVEYRGSKRPEIAWKQGERTLNSHSTYHNESYISASLMFNAERKYNGYKFQCEVRYPFDENVATCETNPLQILFPVQVNQVIIDPHADQHVYQTGKNINLSCRAIGNPQPKYRWTFKAKGDNYFKDGTLSTEPTYKITDAQLEDEGIYNCTVTNNINGTLYIDSRTRYIKIDDGRNAGNDDDRYRCVIIQPPENVSKAPEKPAVSHGVSPYAIGAVICAIIAVILILVFFVLAMKFRDQCFLIQMKKNEDSRRLSLDDNLEEQEVELLEDSVWSRSSSEEAQNGRLKLYWEIPRKDVRFSDQIATGRFVEVWKGKMKKYPDSSEIHKVAIKKLKDDANEQERKIFLAEMEVQKMIQPHPNVTLLIACYTFHEPWLLMLEYAQEGTLHRYLQGCCPGLPDVNIKSHGIRRKSVSSHNLLAIAAQVVNGLMHLLTYKLIYYRLKSSNILVGRGGICKLSGFGFPYEIKERNQYEPETRPVGWMSPESIRDDVYSYRSDIWSYGVLLWEIIHYGLSPYSGLDNTEISQKILSGEKLEKPPHCSEELYNLMMQCWKEDPMARKEYPDILQELSNLADDHCRHIMIGKLPDACRQQQSC